MDNFSIYRQKKRRYALLISLGITITIYILMQSTIFQNFENKTFDYRMRLRGTRDISDKIVIVFICNETLAEFGFPLPRGFYAAMLHCLKEFGAATIGFDVLYFDQGNFNEDDRLLVEETQKAGSVIAPIYFYLSREEYLKSKLAPSDGIIPADKSKLLFYGQRTGLYQAVNVMLPFENLRNACKSLGHVNVNADQDGITRHVPLLIEYNGWVYSALSFALTCDYLGIQTENVSIDYGNKITINIPGEKSFFIPINERGEIYINYNGPDLNKFPNYSFLQVLQAYNKYRETNNPAFLPEIDLRTFKDKIVLIGFTALGTTDVHSTPFVNKDALIGVHANVIDSILMRKFIWDAPLWLNILIALGLALMAGFSLPRFTFRRSLIFIIGAYILIIAIIIGCFLLFGMVLAMFFPSMTLITTTLVISMFLIRYEEIEKLYLEKDKSNVTRKLWEKERQLHSIYDQLMKKEGLLLQAKDEIQKEKDESSLLKVGYEEMIRKLESDRERLLHQQVELNTNKEQLEYQLKELEITEDTYQEKKKPPLTTRDELKGDYSFIKGNSEKLIFVLEMIDKAAPTMANVMITGPTGSGKELMARAVHINSPRANGAFVAVNCAAIPRDLIEGELFGFEKGAFTGAVNRHIGKFEQATKGTIFLDEIGDMSLDTQSKVLRAIQEKVITRIGGKEDIKIDVRIITATHKNLKEEIEKKTFRADLFFRLNVIPLILPSLAERKEDIPLMIEHFVEKIKTGMKISAKIKIDAQAMQALIAYHWPGNIRELENMVERLMTLKRSEGEIAYDDLPPEITGKSPHFELELADDSLFSYQTLKDAVEEFEKRFIIHKLNQFNWNKSKTAELIQLGRRNLHKKISKYNIEEDKDRIEEIEF